MAEVVCRKCHGTGFVGRLYHDGMQIKATISKRFQNIVKNMETLSSTRYSSKQFNYRNK